MSNTIGFVGGGQMAEALIRGLLQAGTCRTQDILVTEPLEERRNYLGRTYEVSVFASVQDMAAIADSFLLAVKPQVMATVLQDLKPVYAGKLIITIAAGLPMSFYAEHLGTSETPLVRVMPNTPALILEGASALCRNQSVSDSELSLAETLFSAVGTTVIVDEKSMDAVTGLSGSGPAYVFSFIEAMIEGGVKTGLSREVAKNLVVQTVLGAAMLAKHEDIHPAELRARVTSPGGTTVSGLHVLESAGFCGTVMSAVEAACNRSIELGKS